MGKHRNIQAEIRTQKITARAQSEEKHVVPHTKWNLQSKRWTFMMIILSHQKITTTWESVLKTGYVWLVFKHKLILTVEVLIQNWNQKLFDFYIKLMFLVTKWQWLLMLHPRLLTEATWLYFLTLLRLDKEVLYSSLRNKSFLGTTELFRRGTTDKLWQVCVRWLGDSFQYGQFITQLPRTLTQLVWDWLRSSHSPC